MSRRKSETATAERWALWLLLRPHWFSWRGGWMLPAPEASRENVRWLLKCFVKWKYKTGSIYVSTYLPCSLSSSQTTSPVTLSRKSVLNIHWKDWCWSWTSNTLAPWWEELTHLKRLWCWERLRAGGEGDDRGWDGWIASPTQWMWVCVNSELVMDREAWPAATHGFTKSRTRLSDWTELKLVLFCFNTLHVLIPGHIFWDNWVFCGHMIFLNLNGGQKQQQQ